MLHWIVASWQKPWWSRTMQRDANEQNITMTEIEASISAKTCSDIRRVGGSQVERRALTAPGDRNITGQGHWIWHFNSHNTNPIMTQHLEWMWATDEQWRLGDEPNTCVSTGTSRAPKSQTSARAADVWLCRNICTSSSSVLRKDKSKETF